MYFSLSALEELPFNRKKVNGLITIIQSTNNERLAANKKFELFKMMRKIVVKNVANYQSLVQKSVIADKGLENEEVEAECFIVLDKCLTNYNVSTSNCFYFYYNKSLTRSLYRLFYDGVREHEKFQEFHSHEMQQPSAYSSDPYDIDFLLTFMDLDWRDRKIIKSKLNKENKKEFIDKMKGLITAAQYQNSIKHIKNQMQIFKDNE